MREIGAMGQSQIVVQCNCESESPMRAPFRTTLESSMRRSTPFGIPLLMAVIHPTADWVLQRTPHEIWSFERSLAQYKQDATGVFSILNAVQQFEHASHERAATRLAAAGSGRGRAGRFCMVMHGAAPSRGMLLVVDDGQSPYEQFLHRLRTQSIGARLRRCHCGGPPGRAQLRGWRESAGGHRGGPAIGGDRMRGCRRGRCALSRGRVGEKKRHQPGPMSRCALCIVTAWRRRWPAETIHSGANALCRRRIDVGGLRDQFPSPLPASRMNVSRGSESRKKKRECWPMPPVRRSSHAEFGKLGVQRGGIAPDLPTRNVVDALAMAIEPLLKDARTVDRLQQFDVDWSDLRAGQVDRERGRHATNDSVMQHRRTQELVDVPRPPAERAVVQFHRLAQVLDDDGDLQ